MAHPKCPHCQEEITTPISGFVSEATLKERLKGQAAAKDAEITALSTRVTELEGKTTGHDAIVQERDRLKSEVEGMKRKGERTSKLTEAKLDAALLDHVEVLYNSSQAGAETPKAFEVWLAEDAAKHPLLAPHFGKAGTTGAGTGTGTKPAGTTAGTGTGTGTGTNKLPDTPAGSDPAGPGGKMTPEQLRTYFGSAEFQGLDRAKKKEKIAELKGQVPSPGTGTG